MSPTLVGLHWKDARLFAATYCKFKECMHLNISQQLKHLSALESDSEGYCPSVPSHEAKITHIEARMATSALCNYGLRQKG